MIGKTIDLFIFTDKTDPYDLNDHEMERMWNIMSTVDEELMYFKYEKIGKFIFIELKEKSWLMRLITKYLL